MKDNYLEEVETLKQDCDRMGREFVHSLRERTGEALDVTGIPIALAAAFDELVAQNKVDTYSFYLKTTLSRFIGMRLERYAPGIEALWKKLNEIGATSADKKVNNSGDNYIYAIKGTRFWRYSLICQTQNRSFIVLMRYGRNAQTHPDKIKQNCLENDPNFSQKDIEKALEYYRPQIYIIQQHWKKKVTALEHYAELDDQHLPDWIDNIKFYGYVAFLEDGEVKGAINHYAKINYCLYNLAAFIEYRDELELD